METQVESRPTLPPKIVELGQPYLAQRKNYQVNLYYGLKLQNSNEVNLLAVDAENK